MFTTESKLKSQSEDQAKCFPDKFKDFKWGDGSHTMFPLSWHLCFYSKHCFKWNDEPSLIRFLLNTTSFLWIASVTKSDVWLLSCRHKWILLTSKEATIWELRSLATELASQDTTDAAWEITCLSGLFGWFPQWDASVLQAWFHAHLPEGWQREHARWPHVVGDESSQMIVFLGQAIRRPSGFSLGIMVC